MSQKDIVAAWRAAFAREQEVFLAWFAIRYIDITRASQLSDQLSILQAETTRWFNMMSSTPVAPRQRLAA